MHLAHEDVETHGGNSRISRHMQATKQDDETHARNTAGC